MRPRHAAGYTVVVAAFAVTVLTSIALVAIDAVTPPTVTMTAEVDVARDAGIDDRSPGCPHVSVRG